MSRLLVNTKNSLVSFLGTLDVCINEKLGRSPERPDG